MSEAEIRSGYAALGYDLLFPEDVLGGSREELARIAEGVIGISDEVYRRDLALSAERTRQLVDDVVSGHIFLFVLLDGDKSVVATTAFVRVESVFPDSRVSSYEAGRTAKRPGTPTRLAADFLHAMSVWSAGHLRGSDHLVAHARVARAQPGRPYNGGVLARLLGHEHFVPTHAVYSNYVAQTAAEPFVWGCAPIDPASWRDSVREQRIHLPDDDGSRMFDAMLSESFQAQVVYTASGSDPSPMFSTALRELAGPSPKVESLYMLTGHPLSAGSAVAEVPGITRSDGTRVSAGLSDRIIVEEDIVSRPDSVHAVSALRRQGFDLAGWIPSSCHQGRLALVMTRPGTVPAEGVSVALPDLSALDRLPAARRFLEHVLARRPSAEISAGSGRG